MGQVVNSSTFLMLRAAVSAFTGRITDPGHDSAEEIKAMEQIEAYARTTGPLGGGGTVVQMMGENVKSVVAWISPHMDDPIIVRVKAGETIWAHADSFEEGLIAREWMPLKESNWASHKHAVRTDEIIRSIFPQVRTQLG